MRFLMISALLATATFQSHQLAGQTGGQDADDPQDRDVAAGEEGPVSLRFNLPIKTAGGTQLWTDYISRNGYRIQKNSLTGHCRLVDENDVRRAWGSRQQCDKALAALAPAPEAPEKPRHVVVLLHGLMRTHHSMKPMEDKLKDCGFDDACRFSYASTRSSIKDHAVALRSVLEDYPANTQFSFVGHSMGNIVVRHLIGDLNRDGDPHKILPRCQSMVMLGPPNQGAAIARRLAPTGVYKWITGKGGMELGAEWKSFVKKLETPEFPFAIIAGDLSSGAKNPLVDGPSDFVVSVEEARLDGAEEFHTIDAIHSFLMNDEMALDLTTDFIKDHCER